MGPKPRDYTYRPPKKVRRGALCAALSLRAREKALVIVDSLRPRRQDQGGPSSPHQAAEADKTRWWSTTKKNDQAPPRGAQPGRSSTCSPPRASTSSRPPPQDAGPHLGGGEGPRRRAALEAKEQTMRPTDVIKGPLITEKLDTPGRSFRQSRRSSSSREAHQATTVAPRGPGAVQGHRRRRPHPHHPRQDQARGPEHGQAPQLQEGDRHPEEGDKIELFEGGVV